MSDFTMLDECRNQVVKLRMNESLIRKSHDHQVDLQSESLKS